MKAEYLILSIRVTGCSHIFHDEIKLTDYSKFYILITVIKINFDKNNNNYYFCKLMTDLLQCRRFNLYLNEF